MIVSYGSGNNFLNYSNVENSVINKSDVRLIITTVNFINDLLRNDKIVIFVYEKYSFKDAAKVYENGFEYYIPLAYTKDVVSNICTHRLFNYSFNESFHTFSINNEVFHLSKHEYALIKYLYNHANEICSRKQLLIDVFSYHELAESRIVDVYIKHLRTKLKDQGKRIQTVRGQGYAFYK